MKILFSGASSSGKTTAMHLISHELGLKIKNIPTEYFLEKYGIA
jgi:uridine kinase